MERLRKIKQILVQENNKRCPKYGMKKLSIGFVSCVIGFTLFFSPVAASKMTLPTATDGAKQFIERDIVSDETKIPDDMEEKDTQPIPRPSAKDIFEGDRVLKVKESIGITTVDVKLPGPYTVAMGLYGPRWTIIQDGEPISLDSEIIDGDKYILVPIPDSINLKKNDEIKIANKSEFGEVNEIAIIVKGKDAKKDIDRRHQSPGIIDLKVVDGLEVENGKSVPKNTIALLFDNYILSFASTSSSDGLSIAEDGTLVGTPNITDWRKDEEERQITLTVTYFYKDLSNSTLGFIEKEIPVTVKANLSDKIDVNIPKDKVQVLNLNKLTDAEREEVKNKILAINKFPQGTALTIDEVGNVTVKYLDDSVDKVSKDELVTKKIIKKEDKKDNNKDNKKEDNSGKRIDNDKKDSNKSKNKGENKKENKKTNKNKIKKDNRSLDKNQKSDKKELKINNKNIDKEKKKDSKKVSYLMGYEDGTIRPDANVTRAEAVTMLVRLKEYSQKESKEIYADGAGWFSSYINAAYDAGILEEKMGENFRPNENITRAEFAQMISHIDKKNGAKAPFKDIAGHKYEAAINQIFGNDRIKGYGDGTFRPDREITRAEIATLLNRVFERKVDKNSAVLKNYKDLNKNHWAYYEIMEASGTDR